MDNVWQRSGELFESGFYCAESVLLAIAESKAIQSDLIPKIATGFCAGMSRTCGMCGAISGGIIAINLFTGRNSPTESLTEAFSGVRKLIDVFEARFGSTNCRQLTGCDLGTEEGQRFFKNNNLREQCKRYTEDAAGMVIQLIEEMLSHRRDEAK